MAYKRNSPAPISEGGINASSLATTDGVIYYDGTKLATTSVGSSGQVLRSAGAGSPPSYSTATYPNTAGSSGNVLTSDGTNWISSTSAGVTGPGSSTDRALATWNGTGGSALFDNSSAKIDSSGRMTNTSQPSFTAYKSSSSANVTGDGTAVTVICNIELADVGSNFNSTTGIFTAPVTGNYLFNFCILFQSMTASHAPELYIVTTATSYLMGNYGSSFTGNFPMSFSVVAPMTAGDTAFPQAIVANSTKTVSIFGAGSPIRTFFSGTLLC